MQLTREEEADASRGILPLHKLSQSSFLAVGLDLEEQQWVAFSFTYLLFAHNLLHRRGLRMRISQADGHLTRKQLTEISEARIALHRHIHAWREAQMVYMPCVASLLVTTEGDGEPTDHAKNISLWLPSSLPTSLPSVLRTTGLSPGLLEKEAQLWLAQADDALAEIRRQRRIVTGLVIFKKLNISGTGQKKNTRMRALFKRFNNKTMRVADRYRAARSSLEVLDPEGSWRARLQVLRPEDIRGPGRDEHDQNRRSKMTEKRREQSWIWLVPRIETAADIGEMEEHLDANLRVEWAKSRARAARWSEEVDLLLEEMRRTLAFFEWRAGWWRDQGLRRSHTAEVDICHGLQAYAEKQADLLEQLAHKYAKYWLPILKAKGISPCWESRYPLDGTAVMSAVHVEADISTAEDEVAENQEESEGEVDSEIDSEVGVEDIDDDDYEVDF